MNVHYKRKKLNSNLIIAAFWITWGIVSCVITEDPINLTDVHFIIFGVFYIGVYFYQRHYQYVTIKDGVIKKNYPFAKKILITDITRIKKFTQDYVIVADTKEIIIDTRIIKSESVDKLNQALSKLNLTPDKTPFARPIL